MTIDSPVGPTACEGCCHCRAVSHVNGCLADAAALRSQLATAREDIAAYLLDRADQYATRDWRWNPLSGAAHDIMGGAVDEALAHGELQEPELRRRVRNWRKK